jgi:hypothetical protein
MVDKIDLFLLDEIIFMKKTIMINCTCRVIRHKLPTTTDIFYQPLWREYGTPDLRKLGNTIDPEIHLL